jgi:hypothetical protein
MALSLCNWVLCWAGTTRFEAKEAIQKKKPKMINPIDSNPAKRSTNLMDTILEYEENPSIPAEFVR